MVPQGGAESLEAENARLRARVLELETERQGGTATFLRSVLAAAPAIILHVDREHRIRFVNRVFTTPVGEVIGTSVYDYLGAGDADMVRGCIDQVLETGIISRYAVTSRGPGGTQALYETHVAPVGGPDDIEGVCLVSLDVTEVQRRAEALSESERKLRIAVEATGIGLWSWDLATGEVTWDDQMRALCGRDAPATLASYVETVVHPDDRELVDEGGRLTFATGRFVSHPHRIVRPDGSVRWMLTSGTMLHDEKGTPVRLVGGQLDITEQRALEDQLLQAQKIDAVGRLTSGIAHNFNNLLMIIGPSLELLEPTIPRPHRQLLADAQEATARAADLVRQLLTFTGQRRTGLRSGQSVATLVRRVIRMCSRTFDRHIELCDEVPTALPPLRCDPGAIEQVLLNVLLNARDAVLESGKPSPRIAITAEVVSADQVPATRKRGVRYLRVAVRDDGIGMDEAVRAHMFEPFFTTKPVGQGNGLGLATCYAVVREHDGFIACVSRPGEGTTIAIELPLDEVPGEVLAPSPSPSPTPPSGVSVLIVDDEETIRRVVGKLLIASGYRVTAAASGTDALAVLTEHQPDVILLDRSMPVAPGPTLVTSLREAAPQARIAYFTGQEVDRAERRTVDAVIRKPVTLEQLNQAIATLLHARA